MMMVMMGMIKNLFAHDGRTGLVDKVLENRMCGMSQVAANWALTHKPQRGPSHADKDLVSVSDCVCLCGNKTISCFYIVK